MKKYIFVVIGLWMVGVASGAEKIRCAVVNPLNTARTDEPVVVRFADVQKSVPAYSGGVVAVWDGDKAICVQQDDLDGDGRWDELVFLTDIAPKGTKTFTIQLDAESTAACAKEVHAQMFLNNRRERTITSTLEASSPTGDMYQALHHHGPAWESDKIAYRLYFDKKITVDVYGKKKYRLELDDAKWYPTGEQLAASYGDDILWVGSSVGVGTIKGWNGKEALHVEPVSNRTARIVINGNIRTVVDMLSEGWQYRGQSLNLTARYIQYARHRDMTAQIIINGVEGQKEQEFCTGVQKVRQSQTYLEKDGLMALWGTEYPTPDSVKYQKETFGLGVILPEKNIVTYTSDPLNHLIVIKNNKQPVIEYTVTAASFKEEQGYKTADEFFAYMRDLKQLVNHPLTVKLEKL
jgi:hypothetical protein